MHTDVGQKGEGSDYHFSAMEILNLYGTQKPISHIRNIQVLDVCLSRASLLILLFSSNTNTRYLPTHTTYQHTLPTNTHYLPTHATYQHTLYQHTLPTNTHYLPTHTTYQHTLPTNTHYLPTHATYQHTLPTNTHYLPTHTTYQHTLHTNTHWPTNTHLHLHMYIFSCKVVHMGSLCGPYFQDNPSWCNLPSTLASSFLWSQMWAQCASSPS